MTKQLTPAEELRVLDKAATILAEGWAGTFDDCPDPSKFAPNGKCNNPNVKQCGACFREWAIDKAIKEMEASK